MVENSTMDLATRFTAGYGLADLSSDASVERLLRPHADRGELFRLTDVTSDPAIALEYLSVLSVPASRHVIVPVSDDCTALVNNHRNGSDYADYRGWLARHLKTRFARIVDRQSHVWSNGSDRITMRYAARIFELFDPEGCLIRSVACMDDGGKWVFHEAGHRHAIENAFPYSRRSERQRFNSEQLQALVRAFGLVNVDASWFLNAGKYVLVEQAGVQTDTCTLAEADDPAYLFFRRGLSWTRHIETHASSVVADFQRCLDLNPAYGPKVKPWIERARQILASRSDA